MFVTLTKIVETIIPSFEIFDVEKRSFGTNVRMLLNPFEEMAIIIQSTETFFSSSFNCVTVSFRIRPNHLLSLVKCAHARLSSA